MSKKETYADKRDFMTIGISDLAKTVELAVRADKPIIIVGEAGVGKTDIICQVAEKLKMECLPLHAAQMVPEDLTGIPVPDLENEIVKFLTLELLPKRGNVILFLDEFTQADNHVTKVFFQLFTDRKIGTYTLPDTCRLVAATNPDGQNYHTIKPSSALTRRLLWVAVKFEVHTWIKWAKANEIHENVW